MGRMRRLPKQGALDLGRHSLWMDRGGRPPGPDPRERHLSREDFPGTHPCHVTLKIVRGVGSIRKAAIVREIEDSFREANVRGDFRLVVYSFQKNHAHLIVEAKDAAALGRGMKSLCSRLAHAVNRVLGRSGKVLADRYHLTVLKNPLQVWHTLLYVLCNSRRHEKQRIDALERSGIVVPALPNLGTLDGASSARWFPGWRRDIPIDRSPPCGLSSLPVVVAAKTWLLNVGWCRY